MGRKGGHEKQKLGTMMGAQTEGRESAFSDDHVLYLSKYANQTQISAGLAKPLKVPPGVCSLA